MNQPKPRQIRLPFSVPKPGRSKGQSRSCGICRTAEGKYTCPRCNLVYCSLACFRDQAHVQCSETFYKSTVMDQIASDPQAGLDDKKSMLEMLRRFEDQAGAGLDGQDQSLGLDDEEDEDEDELERRLRDVDLDDIDSNKLFHLLPQEHRDAFIAALRAPDSEAGRELFDTLKANEEGGGGPILPAVLPWWEASEAQDELDDDEDEMEYARLPELVSEEVMVGITPPEGVGKKLVYNALAICVAYLHTLLSFRLPSLNETYVRDSGLNVADVKSEIGRLVPFMVDPKSTIRHSTTREAYSSVWEGIGIDEGKPTTGILVRLLESLLPLIHPPITTDPPRLYLVLSDLYRIYATPKAGLVAKKLLFYLAALRQLERQDWLSIERELRQDVGRLQTELGETGSEPEEQAPNRDHLLL